MCYEFVELWVRSSTWLGLIFHFTQRTLFKKLSDGVVINAHFFFVLFCNYSVENGNWQSETKLRDDGLYWTRHICSHVYMGFTKFTTLMHNYLNFFMLFSFLASHSTQCGLVWKSSPLIFFSYVLLYFCFPKFGFEIGFSDYLVW